MLHRTDYLIHTRHLSVCVCSPKIGSGIGRPVIEPIGKPIRGKIGRAIRGPVLGRPGKSGES